MFRVDVTVDGKRWLTNRQLFKSTAAATDYLLDCGSRWLGVRAARIVNLDGGNLVQWNPREYADLQLSDNKELMTFR